MSNLHKHNKLFSACVRISGNPPWLVTLTASLLFLLWLAVGCTPSEAGIKRRVQTLLGDGSFDAVDEIVDIGERAVEPLLSALEDQSPTIRRGSVRALGQIGDARAKDALYQAFFEEGFKDQTSTSFLLEALVNLDHPLVVDVAVIAYAERRGGDVAYEIISNPGYDTKGAFIRVLEHDDANVRELALRELHKAGFVASLDLETKRLVVDLLTSDAVWGRGTNQDIALEIVTQMGPSAVDSLGYALNKNPSNSRVIGYLGEIASPEAAAILVDCLDTVPHTTRPDILEALLEIAKKEPIVASAALQASLDSLISMITDKSDLAVQWSAAKLLTSLGRPRALEGLLQGLQAYAGEERQTAFVRLLGELGDPGAIDALIPLLSNEDEDIRDDVITALADIDHPRVVEPLVKALKDNERDIRGAAAYHLNLMDDRNLAPLLDALWNKDLSLVADAYLFFIFRGEPGSEGVLIEALRTYGTQEMAVDYLNSGHEPLEAAARAWAEENGYMIMQFPSFDSPPKWPKDG